MMFRKKASGKLLKSYNSIHICTVRITIPILRHTTYIYNNTSSKALFSFLRVVISLFFTISKASNSSL